MNHDKATTILSQALDQQNKQLLCMLDALHREHQALSSSDIENFELAVKNKQEHLIILEKMQSQLAVLEPVLNGKLSKETIENFIKRMPSGSGKSQLNERWVKLQQTLIDCSKQNIINNKVIDASSTHLRQTLNILRGDLSGPTVNLYSSSGRQNNNIRGQSLATA